jgi:hypothetical protein
MTTGQEINDTAACQPTMSVVMIAADVETGIVMDEFLLRNGPGRQPVFASIMWRDFLFSFNNDSGDEHTINISDKQ